MIIILFCKEIIQKKHKQPLSGIYVFKFDGLYRSLNVSLRSWGKLKTVSKMALGPIPKKSCKIRMIAAAAIAVLTVVLTILISQVKTNQDKMREAITRMSCGGIVQVV